MPSSTVNERTTTASKWWAVERWRGVGGKQCTVDGQCSRSRYQGQAAARGAPEWQGLLALRGCLSSRNTNNIEPTPSSHVKVAGKRKGLSAEATSRSSPAAQEVEQGQGRRGGWRPKMPAIQRRMGGTEDAACGQARRGRQSRQVRHPLVRGAAGQLAQSTGPSTHRWRTGSACALPACLPCWAAP